MSKFTAVASQTGIIVLPKIEKGTGKFIMTSILAGEITGVQPAQVTFGNKTFDGAKVYTVHGDYFKVIVNPVNMVQGWHAGKQDANALITMDALTAIPAYAQAQKQLASGK